MLECFARLLQSLGGLQRLADGLHRFVGGGDVELRRGDLQSGLHLRQLGERLAEIDPRLLHLFGLREHLFDERLDFRAVLFGEFVEQLLQIFFDDLRLGDDRVERL